jgi:Cu-Zn family superoxide dismutase
MIFIRSTTAIVLWLLALPAGAVAQVTAGQGPPPVRGTFAIIDTAGRRIGQVTAVQDHQGVVLQVLATGLSPARHAMHLHAASACEPPAFSTAGSHLNPAQKKHGRRNPDGPHQGDLPNLLVNDRGEGRATLRLVGVTLNAGPGSIGVPGTALILHALEDDEVSDPSGNSGTRLACASIAVSPA